MFFQWFRTFSFHHNDYLAFIVHKNWDIVQVLQSIQTDMPNFHFTELGSNLANQPQNNTHNVYNMQKEYVIQFY